MARKRKNPVLEDKPDIRLNRRKAATRNSFRVMRSGNGSSAFRFINGTDDAYDPPDPPKYELADDALDLFEHVKAQAMEWYQHEDYAEKTAWKSIRMFGAKMRDGKWHLLDEVDIVPSHKTGLPKNRDLAGLSALLLEYVYIQPATGDVVVEKYDNEQPPLLFWSVKEKALYVFPQSPVPNSCQTIPSDMSAEAEMHRRFTLRDPECAGVIDVPNIDKLEMVAVGMMDSLAYRSDKWHDRSSDPSMGDNQEYIHFHGDGVWVEHGYPKGKRMNPNNPEPPVIVKIKGGRLDVEERGIIH